MNTWFCSDWHFSHIKPFLYEPRGFTSPQEMNEAIVNRHNSLVADDDIVFHLGDEIMTNTEEAIEYLKRLNGHINLICGNHTTNNKLKMIINNCPNVENILGSSAMLKYGKYRFYLSHYPAITSNFDDGKTLKERIICLCGHSHTKDPFMDWDRYNAPIYHCEMDAHDCYPVLLDDIIVDMKNKFNQDA